MADFIIRIKDKDNKLIQEMINNVPDLDTAPKGKEYQFEMRERGYKVQYVGTYYVKSQQETDGIITPTVCPPNMHWDATLNKCVEDNPTPIPAGVLFDARIAHPILFSGQVKEYESIGSISPNSNALECRASGNPRLKSNADGTFSLLCDSGHGRFYGYTLNYNSRLEIECAFWNEVSGQDLSLKIRSRHNEGGLEENRFGGYGFSLDRSGWGSKVEQFHNEHSESVSGSLPSKPVTGQYFKVEFSAKDEGSQVRLIAKYNGNQVMSRLVKKYQDLALFQKQSYWWVRSNIDSGTGELRIKNLKVYSL